MSTVCTARAPRSARPTSGAYAHAPRQCPRPRAVQDKSYPVNAGFDERAGRDDEGVLTRTRAVSPGPISSGLSTTKVAHAQSPHRTLVCVSSARTLNIIYVCVSYTPGCRLQSFADACHFLTFLHVRAYVSLFPVYVHPIANMESHELLANTNGY
ncbi:hypothetical protein K438DRAFT_1965030 [Mycena galopus ATCC 62051]|nr:hypothetical protein K438DRAFT_1965030 [Mycena galopus ATCC 62051]